MLNFPIHLLFDPKVTRRLDDVLVLFLCAVVSQRPVDFSVEKVVDFQECFEEGDIVSGAVEVLSKMHGGFELLG